MGSEMCIRDSPNTIHDALTYNKPEIVMSSPDALLCWTVTAYRKDGMTEEAYHKYLSEVHGPLVRGLLAKHGFQSYSLVRKPGLDETDSCL